MFGRGKRETSGTIVPGSYSVSNPIARKFLALDNATLGHLECLKPIIEGNLDTIANEFYRRLTDVPEVEAFIKKHSTVERLKVTLKQLLQKLYVLKKHFQMNSSNIRKQSLKTHRHFQRD